MTKNKQNNTATNWTVAHDSEKCALCTVCAKNCPTKALIREEKDNHLYLYFNSHMCNGCDKEALCEINCPEKAIVSEETDKPGENKYVLLVKSEMAECKNCKELFAPVKRLKVVSEKINSACKKDKNSNLDVGNTEIYCPLCRRTNMVEYLIEEKYLPLVKNVEYGKSKYRSATAILREAAQKNKQ